MYFAVSIPDGVEKAEMMDFIASACPSTFHVEEVDVAQIIENLRQCVEASEAKDKYIKQLEIQADRDGQ